MKNYDAILTILNICGGKIISGAKLHTMMYLAKMLGIDAPYKFTLCTTFVFSDKLDKDINSAIENSVIYWYFPGTFALSENAAIPVTSIDISVVNALNSIHSHNYSVVNTLGKIVYLANHKRYSVPSRDAIQDSSKHVCQDDIETAWLLFENMFMQKDN